MLGVIAAVALVVMVVGGGNAVVNGNKAEVENPTSIEQIKE